MGQVNSRGESRASESDSEPPAAIQGAQPSTKNGRIPGLFRADQRTERLSAQGILAEGEELSSNPLCRIFNDLRTTRILVDVAYRILDLLRRPPFACQAGPVRACNAAIERPPAPSSFASASAAAAALLAGAPNATRDHRHGVALLPNRLAEIDLVLVGERARSGTSGTAQQRAGDRMIEQQAADTASRCAHGAAGERAILGARATCAQDQERHGSCQGHAIHHVL